MTLTAVQAALDRVIVKLPEGPMETCVTDCVKTGGSEEAAFGLHAAMDDPASPHPGPRLAGLSIRTTLGLKPAEGDVG